MTCQICLCPQHLCLELLPHLVYLSLYLRPCVIIMGPLIQMIHDYLHVSGTFISITCSKFPLLCSLIYSFKGFGFCMWASLEAISWATPGDE